MPAPGAPETVPLPVQLLQMITGHWVAQVVGTLARMGVPDQIARGVEKSTDIAAAVGAQPDALYRVLRAAATLGLVTEGEARSFRLTLLGELLREDAPGSLRHFAIAEVDEAHWGPWGRLPEAVTTGRSQTEAALGMSSWAFYGRHPEQEAHFATAMSNLSAMVSAEAAAALDLSGVHRIVDVGGSRGILLAALLQKASDATGVLFDQPQVVAGAEPSLRAQGVLGRVERVGGDFLLEVPAGGDLYALKHIIHDWDDARSEVILRNCRQGMKPESRLAIVEMWLPENREASFTSLMDLNMLVMLDGRERTRAEYESLLAKAGLRLDRVTPLSPPFVIFEARPA
jgi:hypothetical protein